MFLVYRIVRLIRRLLRRCFGGDPPSWAIDIYKAIRVVNFIELIPTIAAIALVPRHFFRRLSLSMEPRRSGIRKSIYKTPIQFVANIVALLFASKLISRFVTPDSFKVALVIILMFLPLLVPLFCALLSLLTGFGILVLGLSVASSPDWIDAFGFFTTHLGYLIVPLTPSTYTHLDWRRAAWCALYFYGYLIAGPIFLIAGTGTLIVYGAQFLPQTHNSGSSDFVFVMIGFISLLVVFVLARVVVFPYSAALFASLKRPTKSVIRSDLYELFSAIRDFEKYCRTLQGKALSASDRRNAKTAYGRLIKAWERFRPWWSQYVVQYSVPPYCREDEKARVLAMSKIDPLLQVARLVSLKEDAKMLVASIYIESKPLAERKHAESSIAEWVPSATTAD